MNEPNVWQPRKGPAGDPSLLAQHRIILGYQLGAMDETTRREKERMAGLQLAPLPLPTQARTASPSGWWVRGRSYFLGTPRLFGFAAAFVALLAGRLLLEDRDPNARLRVKGESKVWVYWERQGDVQLFEPGATLQNGDRVRAEVLATEDLVGYLAVVSGSGLLLGDPTQVRDSALHLKAGEKRTFSGSIKLVGANEDERLVIVLCSAAGDIDLGDAFAGTHQPVNLTALPESCGTQEFMLRGPANNP